MGNDVAQPPSKLRGDYLVNNSKEGETSRTDIESGGFLKHKVESKVVGNEKSILRGGGDTTQSVTNGCSKS